MISDTLKIALLSLALVSLSFGFQGNIGLDLVDEGFLWYGTQRTALGEVPLRDFRSYDPGRYYWGAMWFQVLGDGIIPLRISLAVFQFIGLTCGLLSLRRLIQSWWMLIVFGMILLTWMAPLHRTFETTINMSAIYVAVCLIEKPTLPRHFVAGVFVGVAGFFGRNHGLYNFGAFLFLVLFIWGKIDTRDLVKRVAVWGVGILIGYSPMLFMFFLIPEFFQSFIEGIVVIVRRGTTNLPRAVPWPWLADVWSHPDFRSLGQALSIGMFFVLLPVFHAFALLSLVLSPRENVRTKTLLIASTAVGVMYVHYAFSRADLTHLAGSIHPLLIGLIALPCSVNRGAKRALNLVLGASLLLMSYLSAGIANPYFVKASSPSGTYVYVGLAGDPLWLDAWTAWIVGSCVVINGQKVQPGEGLFVGPYFPGLYPILQRKSPLWEIHFVFPEAESRQREMIGELRQKNVNWVILADYALDGRDDLRFRNTHHLVWMHFFDEFEIMEASGLPPNFQLFHRRTIAQRSTP